MKGNQNRNLFDTEIVFCCLHMALLYRTKGGGGGLRVQSKLPTMPHDSHWKARVQTKRGGRGGRGVRMEWKTDGRRSGCARIEVCKQKQAEMYRIRLQQKQEPCGRKEKKKTLILRNGRNWKCRITNMIRTKCCHFCNIVQFFLL